MWLDSEYQNEERHAELEYRLAETDDLKRLAALQAEIDALWREEWGAAIAPIAGGALLRENIRGLQVWEHWASAAIAADTKDTAMRREWLASRPLQIVGLRVDGITAGAGNPTVVDFTTGNLGTSGTTTDIFATAGNRPTLLSASSGDFTIGHPDQAAGANSDGQGHIFLRAGDRLGYYCVSVGANPHTRVAAAILARHV